MYILDSSKQAELISNLVLIETLDSGWSKRYQNPITGEKWLKFFVGAGHGNFPILRNDPPPSDIAEWMEECFSSSDQDNVIGLALELSQKYETWGDVIGYLETNRGRFEAEKIARFIERLTVLSPINRRSTLNKHYTEIEKDAQYFRDLAERARRL